MPVVTYDDGSYLAALGGLKQLGASAPTSPPQAPPATGGTTQAPPPSPAATGVRGGIDWSTLKPVGPGTTGGNGDPVTNGTYYTVTTVGGKPILVFSADPLAQQPAASQALPGYQDPSTNCHGNTFGTTGVVRPDGTTMNFQIVQAQDVNTLLSGGYTQATIGGASAAVAAGNGTVSVYFVFYDAAGNPIHSGVTRPNQSLFTYNPSAIGAYFGAKPTVGPSTPVESKNGDQNLRPTTTIGDLQKIYGDDIKIYPKK